MTETLKLNIRQLAELIANSNKIEATLEDIPPRAETEDVAEGFAPNERNESTLVKLIKRDLDVLVTRMNAAKKRGIDVTFGVNLDLATNEYTITYFKAAKVIE